MSIATKASLGLLLFAVGVSASLYAAAPPPARPE